MGWSNFLRGRLERELEADRYRLQQALARPDDSTRFDALRRLAEDLGASTIPMYPGHGEASQPELVANIHGAMQTKAMIAAVRTTSNYVIVTVILAAITFLAMIAAFIAAFH